MTEGKASKLSSTNIRHEYRYCVLHERRLDNKNGTGIMKLVSYAIWCNRIIGSVEIDFYGYNMLTLSR
jgi:hypothetical protein